MELNDNGARQIVRHGCKWIVEDREWNKHKGKSERKIDVRLNVKSSVLSNY